jgi:signal transduction histidine kinase
MSPSLHPGHPARARGVFVAVLLLLTLVLAGVLAIQAHAAFVNHRATAERVLRDYARLAAARFAQRAAMQLYYMAFWPVTDALVRARAGTPGTPLPSPGALARGLDEHAAAFARRARYAFRYDFATGRLETAGGSPSPAVRRWLLDTLPRHSRAVYDPRERLAAIVRTVDGAPRAIVYTLVPGARGAGGAPRVALGFEGDPAAFVPFYTMGADKFPLLPRPLTGGAGGAAADSLGSAIVTGADGVELYRTPVQYAPVFAARDSVEPMMGAMQVQVALRPELAPALMIGGMPRSRLPLLAAVLALTAGLIVVALLQLRREYELARLRADFVSSVSHELRTPLAQIRMFSETLLLGRVRSDAERVRSLRIIDQEARRLTHLVENLLHFSRSERRAARLTLAPAALAPLVREAVDGFAPLAAARGVTIVTELAPGLVAPVDGDALRQMLLNLLDNAIKYGPAGQTVRVALIAAGTCARIAVDDEGPGIPPADRERVWERFWRLERDRGAAVAGTGIGLSVVRELAALHGGRVWVGDAPPRGDRAGTGAAPGARFVIELPLVPDGARTPDGSRAAGKGAGAGAGAGAAA